MITRRTAQRSLFSIGLALLVLAVLELVSGQEAAAKNGSDGVQERGNTSGVASEIATGIADKVALLVGINKYEHEKSDGAWADLLGCVRDMERMRELLIRRFGFKPEDIVVLTDDKATHKALLDAFYRGLILRAGPQTEAFFYYAGHGSRVRDRSSLAGKEQDGKDSTYVVYDSRPAGDDEPFDISDDEMHSLLQVLCDRTSRVTVVTDSCHSGGAMRGPQTRGLRAVPDATGPLPLADIEKILPVPFLEDGDPRRKKLSYVHIAACLPDQKAGEDKFTLADGKQVTVGILSYFLIEALEHMKPGTSYEQLVSKVDMRMAMHRRRHLQWLTAEGDLERKVFEGSFAPPPAGLSGGVRAEQAQARDPCRDTAAPAQGFRSRDPGSRQKGPGPGQGRDGRRDRKLCRLAGKDAGASKDHCASRRRNRSRG